MRRQRLIPISFALVGLGALGMYLKHQESPRLEEVVALDSSLNPDLLELSMLKVRARLLNDSDAQYALGRYEAFRNLDFQESNRWLAMAAKQRHAAALYSIAAAELGSSKRLSVEECAKGLEMMRDADRSGSTAAKEYLGNLQVTEGSCGLQGKSKSK